MASAGVVGDRALESQYRGPLRQEVRTQDADDGFDVGFGDVLAAVRDHSIALRLNATISAGLRKCRLLPELYSKPAATGRPVSRAAFSV